MRNPENVQYPTPANIDELIDSGVLPQPAPPRFEIRSRRRVNPTISLISALAIGASIGAAVFYREQVGTAAEKGIEQVGQFGSDLARGVEETITFIPNLLDNSPKAPPIVVPPTGR